MPLDNMIILFRLLRELRGLIDPKEKQLMREYNNLLMLLDDMIHERSNENE